MTIAATRDLQPRSTHLTQALSDTPNSTVLPLGTFGPVAGSPEGRMMWPPAEEPRVKPSRIAPIIAVLLVVGGCGDDATSEFTAADLSDATVGTSAETSTTSLAAASGERPGMGSDSALAQRHRAPIPAEYAGLTSPVTADEESLARGQAAYGVCATCHGDTGLGDGPAGAAFDPAPVNIAHTSQMMGDDYLFWRITDGGAEFQTLMPAWADALDEQTRWDLINYVRALGSGTVLPGRGMGSAGTNTEARALEQAALLAVAVDQGLITQDEANVFESIHETVDVAMADARAASPDETVDALLETVLAALVAAGDVTQGDANTFLVVRDALSGAGLLP